MALVTAACSLAPPRKGALAPVQVPCSRPIRCGDRNPQSGRSGVRLASNRVVGEERGMGAFRMGAGYTLRATLTAALAFALPIGCGDEKQACDSETDPAAPLAVDAAAAAVDAATAVDVTVGGLENWTYVGEDLDEATLEAFLSIFATLDQEPWASCVEYEDTGFSSTNVEFSGCEKTADTPSISGTIHVLLEARLGGEAGVLLHVNLQAVGIVIDGSTVDLTALFAWDPAPEAGLRSQTLSATVRLPSGRDATIAGHVGLDADPGCQTLEGDVATNGAAGTLTAIAYEECLGACPSAGGEIAFDGENGLVRVTFDGTAEARVHDACGTSLLALDCS